MLVAFASKFVFHHNYKCIFLCKKVVKMKMLATDFVKADNALNNCAQVFSDYNECVSNFLGKTVNVHNQI